jgi:hypothetical protein
MAGGSPSRDNLVVALGISAIDVLTCALVSSIVLFLILAAPARTTLHGREGLPDDGLVVQFAIGTPGTAVRVLVFPGQAATVLPVEFWSNRPPTSRRPRGPDDLGVISSLYRNGGYAKWILSAEGSSSDRASQLTLPEATLVVNRPAAGKWRIKLAYSDFAEGQLAPESVDVSVVVTSIVRDCPSISKDITLRLGEPLSLGDDIGQEVCSLAKALDVAAPTKDE